MPHSSREEPLQLGRVRLTTEETGPTETEGPVYTVATWSITSQAALCSQIFELVSARRHASKRILALPVHIMFFFSRQVTVGVQILTLVPAD